ncbi:hypothetical protein [Sulfitobacter sp. MF3-043]|uniref:hypothetical protein n=1 Tax=Sulfitobacter sediminivivens TaxID=3252902 RepID=UPI0036D91EE2
MSKRANSQNMPGHVNRGQAGLAEYDNLLRRYLVHYMVFGEGQLPEIAQTELEFRRMAILQRCRPDVFKAAFPDWRGSLNDNPSQFSVA